MIFARFGHGPCYYHWNEIFAGVTLSSTFIHELGINQHNVCNHVFIAIPLEFINEGNVHVIILC